MEKAAFLFLCLLLVGLASVVGQTLTAEQRSKVESILAPLQVMGTDPVVVQAVRDFNANPPSYAAGMTQDTWKGLSVLDPIIRDMSRNTLAQYLKSKRTPVVDEMFVSGANGTKVALLAKTTSWSHKGTARHEFPMTGKTWIGTPAMDESTGKTSIQVSFPVLDAGRPIGSIVIGLDVTRL